MSCDKCWHDVMKERLSTAIDFELQFIKHNYLRHSVIILQSLKGFGIISLEHLKIWLTHAQFS